MKKLALALILLAVAIVGWWFWQSSTSTPKSPLSVLKPRPLEQYTIDNLSKRTYETTPIILERVLERNKDFISYLFSFKSDGKKVTGQANLPRRQPGVPAGLGRFPAIVMFRGYADQEIYKTGGGTKSAAAFFAKNGFLTIAPDFLGYGESDPQSEDVMEARFLTYTTILNLLESLSTLDQWNHKDVFLWGHSNGGQIALTILEINQKEIPTTLWAPVSKPFPYAVLYYTDESEDRGKFLRRAIAKFEQDYNPDLYSLDLYLDRIQAPLQIHQGTADDAVPRDWSDELVKALEKFDKEVKYHIYPGADHNMKPAWDTVVARDLAFFRAHYGNQP